MRFTIHLRDLEKESLRFDGEVEPDEVDWNLSDELIQAKGGLGYSLEIEKHEQNLLIQGQLSQSFVCECVRCLQSFTLPILLDAWSGFAALEGEDSLEVVNDLIDLTEILREDVLLALPQHPHCGPQCPGLADSAYVKVAPRLSATDELSSGAKSAWDALDHLNLDNDKD